MDIELLVKEVRGVQLVLGDVRVAIKAFVTSGLNVCDGAFNLGYFGADPRNDTLYISLPYNLGVGVRYKGLPVDLRLNRLSSGEWVMACYELEPKTRPMDLKDWLE